MKWYSLRACKVPARACSLNNLGARWELTGPRITRTHPRPLSKSLILIYAYRTYAMQSGHAYWPDSREKKRERERDQSTLSVEINRRLCVEAAGRRKHMLATHVQQLCPVPVPLPNNYTLPPPSQSRLISLSERSDAWAVRHRRVRSLGYRDDKLDLLSVVGVEVSSRI